MRKDRLKLAEEMHRLLILLSPSLPEESVIEVPGVFRAWAEGEKYKKDEYLTYGLNSIGDPQLYKVLKTHKATADKAPGLDSAADLYKAIGVSASGYPVWAQPVSNKDAYSKGDIVDRNGVLYISIKNNNRDDPADNTGRWEVYSGPEPEPEPGPEYPEWVQPENEKAGYRKGDVVRRNGVLYISTKNKNADDPEAGTGTWSVYTPEG